MSTTTPRGGGYDTPVKTAFAFSGAIFAGTILTTVGIFQVLSGIVIAVIGSVSAFAFMPYYPWWALAMLALYIFVIWSLAQLMSSGDEL